MIKTKEDDDKVQWKVREVRQESFEKESFDKDDSTFISISSSSPSTSASSSPTF